MKENLIYGAQFLGIELLIILGAFLIVYIMSPSSNNSSKEKKSKKFRELGKKQ